eukprot:comp21458_c0_seq1/m.29662 comp21458_c0_seq1/g.29662  ORF comp21458_c0_seq1/g.29662 comp21458_c0_seq1/m.29662 type:complete len:303 (-) comp21458_c0_seq1:79-987(-)
MAVRHALAKQVAKMVSLPEQMKSLEAPLSDIQLDPRKIYMARLDGHCFSAFTTGFKKPFDHRINSAMVATTADLVNKYNAVLGYTQSDEITLVFPTHWEDDDTKSKKGPMWQGGRVFKLISLMSSFGSVRFNYHLQRQTYSTDERLLFEKARGGIATFDCRVFNVDSPEDAADNIRWRQTHDGRRNSIGMLARAYFPHIRLHGMNREQMLQILRDEKHVRWEDQPLPFRIGTMVKKEQVLVEGIDPRTNTTTTTTRIRLSARHGELDRLKTKIAMSKMIFAPFWNSLTPEEEEFWARSVDLV